MPRPDTSRRSWRFALATILGLAMVAATQTPAGLGIVASFIRADLGITRTQIGLLITVTMVVGAVMSPIAGRAVDRLGGRRSLIILFSIASAAYLGLAVSPGFLMMFIPITVAAVAQAGGNPVTNKLIAHHASAGRRGVLTGIKQSGVQAGIFVSGLVMPAVAAAWGWRWAFGVVVVVPLAGLIGAVVALPPDHPSAGRPPRSERSEARLPLAIWFLTVFGALMGLGAAYTFFVPLFVEESLGMSEALGGLAAGVIGLTSLFGRIAWARQADRTGRHAEALLVLAIGSVVAAGVFLASAYVASWLIWPAAVLTGVSSSSWNSVGMLAVIGHAGPQRSGHASGVVMLGFLGGLAIGPTLFGALVDVTESYTTMWLASIAVLGVAVVVAAWWSGSSRRVLLLPASSTGEAAAPR